MLSVRKNGSAHYYTGTTRSGKTLLAQKNTLGKKPKRAVIWDASGQWFGACKILGYEPIAVQGIANLAQHLRSNVDGIYCYSTSPVATHQGEFDFFCGASFLYIMQSPAMVIVEELASVSNASSPPPRWQALQNQSQKYGGEVHTIVQRPQEADKSTLTQATDVYILNTGSNDTDYICRAFNIDKSNLPRAPLQVLHLDRRSGKNELLKITPDEASNLPTKAKIMTKKL